MKIVGGRVRQHARIIVLVALLASSTAQAAMPALAQTPTTGQTPIARTETRVGRTDAQKTIAFTVPLKVRDQRALDAAIADLYNPSSPNYRKYLTPAEFTKRFVDPAARADVATFLRGKGFAVADPGIGTVLAATAKVADIERAFNVTISDYRDASGRTFAASDKSPALPAAIAGRIAGVLGLDGSPPERSSIVKPPLDVPAPASGDQAHSYGQVCAAAATTANRYGSYFPTQMAVPYGIPSMQQSGFYGQNQTVALFELDDYKDSNVAAYQACFGTSAPVSRVPVDGGATLGSGEDEVELDIEVVAGLAPALNHVLVYEAPNNFTGIVDEYQRIANDNLAQAVSTSWGSCEAAAGEAKLNAEYYIFQQMATEGMSIFAAAGDSGSQDCLPYGNAGLAVDNPASQPYVTGVGGTSATLDASGGVIQSEAVWNDSHHIGAGGGGLSAVWPKPSFQTGYGVANGYSNGMRQVPDVAAFADPTHGYTILLNDPKSCGTVTGVAGATDCFEPVGGTSAAAPLWAALTALLDEYLPSSGGTRVGFANSTFYAVNAHLNGSNGYATLMNDITSGNNCYQPPCGGGYMYAATLGYDQATGLGSPRNLAQYLLPPAITSYSPPSGASKNPPTIVINGLRLLGSTVSLGGQPCTYPEYGEDTSVECNVPANQPAGTVPIVVTGRNGLSTTAPGGYTYYGPIVDSITPRSGAIDGTTVVTVTGTFYGPASVSFGGVAATFIGYVGSSGVQVRPPAHAAGAVDVVVDDAYGTATIPAGYNYTYRPGPDPTGGSPASEPVSRPGPTSSTPPAPLPAPR
jgi:subtilase family serine protease